MNTGAILIRPVNPPPSIAPMAMTFATLTLAASGGEIAPPVIPARGNWERFTIPSREGMYTGISKATAAGMMMSQDTRVPREIMSAVLNFMNHPMPN